MLELLETHFTSISIVHIAISLVHIIVTTLLVFGILKPISDPKSRMKKKIMRKLEIADNKSEILSPEIGLRDNLLQHPIYRIFLRNFYTLFIESVRELETEEKIVRVSNSGLEIDQDKRKEKFPTYLSKAKKTPADYGLKKDDPTIYIGLNSPEVKNHIAHLKHIFLLMAQKI